jgi:hypothetical protein
VATLPDNNGYGYEKAFNDYFIALGKVAHEWNHMQEEIGKLFCIVAGLDNSMGMAIWHALRSDKLQRDLLEAAVQTAAFDEEWLEQFPHASKSICNLLNEINAFSNKRNAAIHAPCSVITDEFEIEIFAISFSGNPSAKRLRGKDILKEFSWYEATASAYRRYINQIQYAVSDARIPWPDKPSMPTLGQLDSDK